MLDEGAVCVCFLQNEKLSSPTLNQIFSNFLDEVQYELQFVFLS